MVALARMRRRLHLAQQGVHFLGPHPPPRADRPVTGDAAAGSPRSAPAPRRCRLIGQFVRDVAQQRRRSTSPESPAFRAPRLRRRQRVRSPGQCGSSAIPAARGVMVGQVPRCRGSAGPGPPRRSRHLALELFIDQPFMRGMLIDNHDAGSVCAMM